MKIDATEVRFLPVFTWSRRHTLRFVGRANTIQLLETALVIEGQRQTLSYLVIDFLFQQALSEWTTVTVPYSRIERCRWSARWLARGPFIALVVLPVVAGLVATAPALWQTVDGISLAVPLVLFGLLLLCLYAILRLLPAQYDLRFRRPDGKLAVTRFRIKLRDRRQEFEQRLNAYRQAVSARPAGKAE